MPGMNSLLPNVVAAIEKLFTPYEQETITKMLIEECNAEKIYASSEAGVERIQLAVLKLSDGDTDKFLAAVELAQLDWRDVLVAAGFGDDIGAHLEWVDKLFA
jgi:hypothetical protein